MAAVAFTLVCTTLMVVLAVALSLAISAVVDALAPGRNVSSAEAVISVLCFGVFILTLVVQQRHLIRQYHCMKDQLEYMKRSHGVLQRSDLTDQHRLQNEMLYKAIEHPHLAAVLNTFDEDVPLTTQQQYLYCNVVYNNVLHAYRTGYVNLEEAKVHLRVICRSPVFRDFWKATRSHRSGLRYESEEAALGRAADRIVDGRRGTTDPPSS
ncbi:DUF6082 family protein [Streptomyces sp. NPDC051219]|uniref:DUF6082 family protein n=1 Tax=Streptomyces sp. NPDC051219 TaxID=3155283 RepID=UPI00343F77A5